MSTPCTIAMKQNDGKYRAIYCYWDGDRAGETLKKHYATEDRVNALLDLGDISSLGTNPIGYWDNSIIDKTRCSTHNALGEEREDALIFDNQDDVIDYYEDAEFNYFFEEGKWYYMSVYNHYRKTRV